MSYAVRSRLQSGYSTISHTFFIYTEAYEVNAQIEIEGEAGYTLGTLCICMGVGAAAFVVRECAWSEMVKEAVGEVE